MAAIREPSRDNLSNCLMKDLQNFNIRVHSIRTNQRRNDRATDAEGWLGSKSGQKSYRYFVDNGL